MACMRAGALIYLGVTLLGLATIAEGGTTEFPRRGGASVMKFDPGRDAAKDIREAAREAKRSGRRVLLDVGGDWCVWCRRLDSLFATNRTLREERDAHYVTVKVNWSKENKNETVLANYPAISGYPHLFVLDGNGMLLHSQDTGKLEKGKGHDPVKVLAFLKKWSLKKK